MADKIRVLLTEEEVDTKINEIAAKISEDYAGKQIHLICILKGGVFFTCELAKRLTVPVSMDFMSVSSYGAGTESSGVVKIIKDLDEPLEGKDVLIVEDIIDSGRTLSYLIEVLKQSKPEQRPPVHPARQAGAPGEETGARGLHLLYHSGRIRSGLWPGL